MSDEENEETEPKYSIHYSGEDSASEYYTKDGKANVTYANGDTYNGELKDAKKHGKGIYTWKELKSTYDGDWFENIRFGQGKFTYSDGSVYEGEWEEDVRHGNGTYIYNNGDSYCGKFVKGKKQGYGIYTYASDRSQLIGEWENDLFLNGKWKLNDLTIYSGNFNNNLPIDKGLFIFKNGNQLNGKYNEKQEWIPKNIIYNPITIEE